MHFTRQVTAHDINASMKIRYMSDVGYNYDITLGHYIFVILTLHEGYTPDVTLGHHIFITLT